ncbi:MAG TPA: L-threonylcarbamoyladenylate synthase [Cyclobacteriaceae bacterium]|nr:L-threonylcarbamoyladenylate synthase [Cyclobacteriaceae bacterium]
MAIKGIDISLARQYLEADELVAVPTETVYGLAGNALHSSAVAKIFEAKERPSFDPLIIHVPDAQHLERYVTAIPKQAVQLINHFWPGPLTLVLRKKEIIPDLVTAGLDTVGVRCPDHPLTHQLLRQLDFPLAAPSANPFGYVSPTTAEHVEEQLGSKIPYILDGGPCKVGIESTIIGFENGKPMIYRRGGISNEAIERVIGPVESRLHSTSNPKAPGQLQSHYAPRKPFLLGDIDQLMATVKGKKFGVLRFKNAKNQAESEIVLSPSESVAEAAQNLFAALRQLDAMNIDLIIAEKVPDIGIGKAINDRLTRAAAASR